MIPEALKTAAAAITTVIGAASHAAVVVFGEAALLSPSPQSLAYALTAAVGLMAYAGFEQARHRASDRRIETKLEDVQRVIAELTSPRPDVPPPGVDGAKLAEVQRLLATPVDRVESELARHPGLVQHIHRWSVDSGDDYVPSLLAIAERVRSAVRIQAEGSIVVAGGTLNKAQVFNLPNNKGTVNID